jgi:hypothetical protein
MDLAERHAALGATGGLLGRLFPGVLEIDFVEVMAPIDRSPLFGHGLRDFDEFEHAFGHRSPS